ncbi:MAG: DUF3859 domain-containing protein [Roseicyclus sp.]
MLRAVVIPPLLAALALTSGATAEQVGSDAAVRVDADQIAELVYGVYCAAEPVRTEDAPETASGVINIVPDIPEIRFAQRIVPAALDVGFGILSRAPEGIVHDPVTITVTHPPFPDSGIEVERWITRLDDEGLSLTGFSFDVPQELVLGTWTFSAHAGETELFHVTFEVVPPDLARDVLAICQSAFTS